MQSVDECEATEPDVSCVEVGPLAISIAAAALGKFRPEIAIGAVFQACDASELEVHAALARLQAARMLDLSSTLDRYSERALAEAIAGAPLYLVGEYYYFDPGEFAGVLARSEAALRTGATSIMERSLYSPCARS